MSVEDLLATLPVAAGLDAGDRAKLARIATVELHPPGARIYVEGEPADSTGLLVEGRVALSMRVVGRPDVTVLTLGPGELIGWSGLTDEATRAASVRAVEPVRLIHLPREPLRALCEADHDIGYALMRLALHEVARRLKDTRLQLLDVYRSDPSSDGGGR
jgi:CRP-like cAMP-binding protein